MSVVQLWTLLGCVSRCFPRGVNRLMFSLLAVTAAEVKLKVHEALTCFLWF